MCPNSPVPHLQQLPQECALGGAGRGLCPQRPQHPRAILEPCAPLHLCPTHKNRRNVRWVGLARDGVDFAPKDLSKASNFLQREATEGKVGCVCSLLRIVLLPKRI